MLLVPVAYMPHPGTAHRHSWRQLPPSTSADLNPILYGAPRARWRQAFRHSQLHAISSQTAWCTSMNSFPLRIAEVRAASMIGLTQPGDSTTMYKTRMSWIVGILGLLGSVSVVGDADAFCQGVFNDWTYPGSMCRFYGPEAGDAFFAVTGGGTSLRNTSPSTQSIVCPVPTPSITDVKGFSLAEISLSGTGYDASACGVHATSWDGTSTFVAPTPIVHVNGSKSDFVWDESCTLAPAASSFVVSCDIQANSLVYKYEFTLAI